MRVLNKIICAVLLVCLVTLCMILSGTGVTSSGTAVSAVSSEAVEENSSAAAEPADETVPTVSAEAETTPAPVICTLTVNCADGDVIEEEYISGTEVPLDCSAPGGYITVCYEDSHGNAFSGSVTVENDITLTQVCAPALTDGEHTPYLSLSYGFFVPGDTLTRREFTEIIALFLPEAAEDASDEETDPEMTGEDSEEKTNEESAEESAALFEDLAEDDEIYRTAAQLYELGAVAGGTFSPDDVILRGEAYDIISAFLPAPDTIDGLKKDGSGYAYAYEYARYYGWVDEAETVEALSEPLTKIETAYLFNSVLGRSGDAGGDASLAGAIIDIDSGDPDYWTAAEAVIPHTFTLEGSTENWQSSEPSVVKEYEPGYQLVDGRVFYIKEDGSYAYNEEINGFMFGPDGVYTSGNAELDDLIIQNYSESMEYFNESIAEKYGDRYEWLKCAFWQIVRNALYRKSDYHDDGVRGWETDTAISMLSGLKGNCYDFAAAMWAMARALGYDAYLVTGTVYSNNGETPHGWVEIYQDGKLYVVDTELTYNQREYFQDFATELFMLCEDDPLYTGWGYTPDESSLALLPNT